MTWILIIVFAWAIPIMIAHKVGENRGRVGGMYGLIGGWLGLLLLLILPSQHGAQAGERKCPGCAEWVKAEAQVCRYCGHRFGLGLDHDLGDDGGRAAVPHQHP